MDSNTLVAELIRDGQTLLDRLAARGYVVTAAGWVRKPDAGWLLYIATPEGEARGWYAARYDVHEQIRTPPTLLIYPLDVRLVSPTDRRSKVRAKMLEWIANGAELGWMIDPRDQSVTIYRPDREPEVWTGIAEIAGEGPLEGFVLPDTEACRVVAYVLGDFHRAEIRPAHGSHYGLLSSHDSHTFRYSTEIRQW